MLHDQPTSPTPDQLARLLAVAAQAQAHRQLVEQYAKRWLPDPERGQLWRLASEDHAVLALIWTPGPITVSVLPVSEDPDYRDAHTVVLTETPLHAPVGVWTSLEVSVPIWSLDRCLGQLDPEALVATRSSFRAQQRDTSNSPPKDRPWSDLSRYRERLADRFEPFVAWTWAEEHPAVEGATTLGQLLRNRQLNLEWLASRLGIEEPATALLTWQGRRALDEDEASILSEALNIDAGDLRRLSRNVPVELRAQTSRPQYRPRVQDWASKQQLSEVEARERIEERVLAIAARSASSESERWQALLEQFFAAELDSP